MATNDLSNALEKLKKLLKSGASTTDTVNKINRAVQSLRIDKSTIDSSLVADIITGHEVCSRLDPPVYSCILGILLQSKYSRTGERCLYLLAASVYHDSRRNPSRSAANRKAKIGECLSILLGYFIDNANHNGMRRWVGILYLQLLHGCKQNVQKTAMYSEERRRKLGPLTYQETNEIIRVICGHIIRELLEEGGLEAQHLWPIGAQEFKDFPKAQPGWNGLFQQYVDRIWDDMAPPPESTGQLYFAQNVELTPSSCNFGTKGHTVEVSVERKCMTIWAAAAEVENFYQSLEIPTQSIARLTVTTGFSQVPDNVVHLEIIVKPTKCWLDCIATTIHTVSMSILEEAVVLFQEALRDFCPEIKVNSSNHRPLSQNSGRSGQSDIVHLRRSFPSLADPTLRGALVASNGDVKKATKHLQPVSKQPAAAKRYSLKAKAPISLTKSTAKPPIANKRKSAPAQLEQPAAGDAEDGLYSATPPARAPKKQHAVADMATKLGGMLEGLGDLELGGNALRGVAQANRKQRSEGTRDSRAKLQDGLGQSRATLHSTKQKTDNLAKSQGSVDPTTKPKTDADLPKTQGSADLETNIDDDAGPTKPQDSLDTRTKPKQAVKSASSQGKFEPRTKIKEAMHGTEYQSKLNSRMPPQPKAVVRLINSEATIDPGVKRKATIRARGPHDSQGTQGTQSTKDTRDSEMKHQGTKRVTRSQDSQVSQEPQVIQGTRGSQDSGMKLKGTTRETRTQNTQSSPESGKKRKATPPDAYIPNPEPQISAKRQRPQKVAPVNDAPSSQVSEKCDSPQKVDLVNDAPPSRSIVVPEKALVDDHLARKQAIISFDVTGPRNQGLSSSAKRYIAAKPSPPIPAQESSQPKRKRADALIEEPHEGEDSHPMKRRSASPEINQLDDIGDIGGDIGVMEDVGYESSPREPPHVSPAKSRHSQRSRVSKASRHTSQLPRVDANGSPIASKSSQVDYISKAKQKLLDHPLTPSPIPELVEASALQASPTKFEPKFVFNNGRKSRPEYSDEVVERYVLHKTIGAGVYEGVATKEVIALEKVLPDPFVEDPVESSGGLSRLLKEGPKAKLSKKQREELRKLLASDAGIGADALLPQPVNVSNVLKMENPEKIHLDEYAEMLPGNRARSANVLGENTKDANQTTGKTPVLEDSEKTLVDLENQPPSEDLPSQMSDVSYDSDDNEHSRGSMGLKQDGWNMTLRPHYATLASAVHRIADEVVIRMAKEEDVIGLVVNQYQGAGDRLLDEHLRKRRDDQARVEQDVNQKKDDLLEIYKEARDSMGSTKQRAEKDPVSQYEKQWGKRQDEIKAMINHGRRGAA